MRNLLVIKCFLSIFSICFETFDSYIYQQIQEDHKLDQDCYSLNETPFDFQKKNFFNSILSYYRVFYHLGYILALDQISFDQFDFTQPFSVFSLVQQFFFLGRQVHLLVLFQKLLSQKGTSFSFKYFSWHFLKYPHPIPKVFPA